MSIEVRPAPLPRPALPAVVVMLLVVVLAMLRAATGNRDVHGAGWLGVAAVGVFVGLPLVLGLVLALLRRRNLRLEITEDALTLYDLRGRPTSIDRAQVTAIRELVFTDKLEPGAATVVVGKPRTALLTLWHKRWPPRGLGAACERADGRRPDRGAGGTGARDLANSYHVTATMNATNAAA